MNRKQITTEQIEKARELVKDFKKQKERDCYVYCGTLDNDSYCKFIGINFDTVRLLGDVSYSIEYVKTSENKYRLNCLTYVCNTVMNDFCFLLADDTDFLGLFTEEKNEEKQKEKDISLEDFFNDNPGNVLRKLKEMYPDVVSDIVEEVIHDIRNYDLDDSDVEYFAEEYIRDNPVASVEVAEEYLDSDDKKRFMHSWIDEI